jgi:hypothetical protein
MAAKTVTPKRRAARTRSSASGAVRAAGAAQNRPKIVVEDLADFNESINLLVYGDSGVGKTPFAAMAPRAVILSTEKGSISAKRFGSTAKLIRAFDWATVEAALDYLEAQPDDFDWLVLDSLPKMQILLLRYLLGINVEENRKNADIDVPQIQDHQKWQNMFKRFVDRIIDIPINTIFVATAMHKEDAEGEDLVLPDVQGKDYAIAQYVCAQMDGVYCLKIVSPKKDGEPYWRLLTQSKPPYFAKDRYRALPRVIEYPYVPKIIELIQDSIGDGGPLYGPEMMTVPAAPNRSAAEFDEDDIEDLEDEDEDEEPEEPPKRPRAVRSTRSQRKPARGQARRAKAEPDEPDEDWESLDKEDEPEPPKRQPKRRAGNRRPTRKPKPEPEPDEDGSDDFDPDDEIDLEDEDE